MSTITPQDFDMLRIPVHWELDKYGDMRIFCRSIQKNENPPYKKARELGDPISNNTSKYMPSGAFRRRLIAHDNNGESGVVFVEQGDRKRFSFGGVYICTKRRKKKNGRYAVIIATPRQFALKVIHDADECRDTSYYLNTKGKIGKSCELISQKCLNPPGFESAHKCGLE